MMRCSILIAMLATTIASPVLAQSGSTVHGNFYGRVRSGATVAAALGAHSTASISEASVKNSRIRGSADLIADVGGAYAVAAPGAKARIAVSSVKDADMGSVRQYTRAGTLGSYAIMPGSSTCLAVGSTTGVASGSVNSITSVGSVHAYNLGFVRRANIRINAIGGC